MKYSRVIKYTKNSNKFNIRSFAFEAFYLKFKGSIVQLLFMILKVNFLSVRCKIQENISGIRILFNIIKIKCLRTAEEQSKIYSS